MTENNERSFILQEGGATCHTGAYARWWVFTTYNPFLTARRRFVKEKVRHHYEQLRDVEKQKSWDVERIRAAASANRRKSRMQTKMRRRRNNFAKYKLAFEAKYGDDCGTFVERAYMFEEDEDILDEHGNSLTFLNRVPIWRTDKLQAFVHELDKPSMKLKPSANKLCVRTPKPAEETTVSLDTLATLPRWGNISEIIPPLNMNFRVEGANNKLKRRLKVSTGHLDKVGSLVKSTVEVDASEFKARLKDQKLQVTTEVEKRSMMIRVKRRVSLYALTKALEQLKKKWNL
ncbi:uncharacterized protein EV154DRAFT_606018 [Mucor mucedo]|uniref:uncharacterized protein n=1 Tax=Mucor mucedo TaxID=29922 RepID=UPI00221EB0ED|nr:uncharacterized protein EV154DRAFT_606018 [Mucor mucedo]KAI7882799.1 hypothetical protein EV154DRAFT_606018 [Mucor mucedo]